MSAPAVTTDTNPRNPERLSKTMNRKGKEPQACENNRYALRRSRTAVVLAFFRVVASSQICPLSFVTGAKIRISLILHTGRLLFSALLTSFVSWTFAKTSGVLLVCVDRSTCNRGESVERCPGGFCAILIAFLCLTGRLAENPGWLTE